MTRKRNTKKVTDVLRQVFRDRHWQEKMSVNRVFLFWDEVVGGDIAELAQPDVVRAGVLWVSVPDSIWMQQLHFLKSDLLEKINQRLRADSGVHLANADVPQLGDIRFKISRISHGKPLVAPPEKKQKPIDPQREKNFDLLTKTIKDEELRLQIRRLWANLEKRLD